MSERPGDPRSYGSAKAAIGNSGLDTRPSTAHRTNVTGLQNASRRNSGASSNLSPTSHRQSGGRQYELPPLSQLPVAGGPPRSSGITSLFSNPPEDDTKPNRRRKASEIESPSSPALPFPPLTSGMTEPSFRPNLPRESPFATSTDQQNRRILTPRSPSATLRHTASLNQISSATSHASVQNPPFVTSPQSRSYAPEPGAVAGPAPSVPPPANSYRGGYVFPGPSPAQSRRASVGTGRGVRPPSSSASPSTSYSSYSQTSPPAQNPLSLPRSMGYPTPNDGRPYDHSSAGFPSGQDRLRPASIPITSSSGPNSYQLMTYETTSGAIQLPVDMHAASRAADEKRRRNAGASARFRQRRKEKEKEASTTIARLEQQVKELGEDAEYYKRERDYLSAVVMQVPGGERHFPRPHSPNTRRAGSSRSGPNSYRGGHRSHHSGAHSPDEERSRPSRRRTASGMSLPPPPPPAAAPPPPTVASVQPAAPAAGPGPQQQSPYTPQAYHIPLLAQREQPQIQPQAQSPYAPPNARPTFPGPSGPSPGPIQQSQQQQQQLPQHYREQSSMQPPPGPQHLMQASPQTGPWNPFAADKRQSRAPPGPQR